MAVVKSRTSKRSSSSSGYSSTLTTIIFVSLCVFGVWMLSSDTISPLKSTNRSAATVFTRSSSSSSALDEERETPDPEHSTKTNVAAYADSQGDLPEDAIKIEESVTQGNNDDHKDESSSSSEGGSGDSGDQMATSTDTVTEVGSDDGSEKQEQQTGQENDKSESGNGEVEAEQDTVDEKVTNPPGSVVEETKGEDSGSNQSQHHTTDNDQVEEDSPKENNENVISDEDQQKRLMQHHKQEDDQMKQAGQTQNETGDNEENQKVANKDIDQKEKASKPVVKDSFPAGDESGIPKESKDSKKSLFG